MSWCPVSTLNVWSFLPLFPASSSLSAQKPGYRLDNWKMGFDSWLGHRFFTSQIRHPLSLPRIRQTLHSLSRFKCMELHLHFPNSSQNVLMTDEMHILIINFTPQFFLSALHVSNESGSSSGARHNILYYTHSILCCAPDDERLDSFETWRADKKLWNNKNLL